MGDNREDSNTLNNDQHCASEEILCDNIAYKIEKNDSNFEKNNNDHLHLEDKYCNENNNSTCNQHHCCRVDTEESNNNSTCDQQHCCHVDTEESNENELVLKMHSDINKEILQWEKDGQLTSENLEKAIETYNKALEISPSSICALLGKAYVHGLMDEKDLALETLLKAKVISPDNEKVNELLDELNNDNSDISDFENWGNLITSDFLLTKELEDVLSEVFNRFSRNDALGPEELNEYCLFVNNSPLPDEGASIFGGGFELTSDGKALTRTGFLQFYHNQTLCYPAETHFDLIKLGYGDRFPITNNKSLGNKVQ